MRNFEWAAAHVAVPTSVVFICKKIEGDITGMKIIQSELGDWSDLVYVLYSDYNQFKDQLDHLGQKQKHEKMDEIARGLEKSGSNYQFKLPDRTDEWYVGLVKDISLAMDSDGNIS